jgi:hypothetical protein
MCALLRWRTIICIKLTAPVCHWQATHGILLENRTLWRPASAESSAIPHWLAAVRIGVAIKLAHGGLPVAHEGMLVLRRTFGGLLRTRTNLILPLASAAIPVQDDRLGNAPAVCVELR